MGEEQAWENEGNRRDWLVMCEMLVCMFFWQSPTPAPVTANCLVFIIHCIPNDFPCEWNFYSAWPDCELHHELSSEWDERSRCLQVQRPGSGYQLLGRPSIYGQLVKKSLCVCASVYAAIVNSLWSQAGGRTVLCKTIFGLPFTCYNFCWFFYCRWINKYKF